MYKQLYIIIIIFFFFCNTRIDSLKTHICIYKTLYYLKILEALNHNLACILNRTNILQTALKVNNHHNLEMY